MILAANCSRRLYSFCVAVLSVVFWSGATAFAQEPFEVVEHSPDQVVLSLKPFDLNIKSMRIEDKIYHQLGVADFGVTTEPGFPALPQAAVLIQLPFSAAATVTVLESQFEELPAVDPLPAPFIFDHPQADEVVYQYREDQAFSHSDSFWPPQVAAFSEAGRVRGLLLGRIQANPVQYNPARKTLRVYKTLKIQIVFSQPLPAATSVIRSESEPYQRVLRSLLLDRGTAWAADRVKAASTLDFAANDWYNPRFTYYKLMVDEEGIYALTYDDLRSAGIDVDALNMERIKIYNRGQEIPVWIAGSSGPTFTPEDTLYFYGDRHRGSDRYFDLYTDTNVYWLTADGQPGKRYRLISDTNPTVPTTPYYGETLHLENENQLHFANGSSEWEPEEGWIWRYFFDNDREIFEIQLSGLVPAVDSCSVRIHLQGTTQDPVNLDHHVRLFVNDNIVGETYFDDREDLIWTLTISTDVLKEGQNKVELHLVPDTGSRINQIYLDWFEIRYPRIFAANASNLKFQQAGSTISLSRFSLLNFRDDNITIFDPVRGKLWQPSSEKASFFRVESAGLDDGYYVRLTADFETQEYKRRGHTLLAIQPIGGAMETRHFDTHADTAAANVMASYIQSLPSGSVVLAGISDEGSVSMTEAAYQALESLGSARTRQVGFRDSWALIGWKGAAIGSVEEAFSPRFSGPAVAADTLTGEQAFRFQTAFSDTLSPNSFYYAVSRQGMKKVERIEKEKNSTLRSPVNGADYLIISHENFIEEAARLAEYRRDHNGFRTAVVDVQDVYDEFSFGIVGPYAIKDFLTYAYLNWQPPAPTYVLLLGDASLDPKKLMPESVKTSYVPSYGILVTDNWFVTLDGADDILPDMLIGRLPVETPEQAATVVDKIIASERLPFDSWSKEIAFLNGGINPTEQNIFRSQSNTLISRYIEPSPFSGRAVNFNKTTTEAITRSLERAVSEKIHDGLLWVNFLGHAASTVWDIDAGVPEDWQNEIFPFVSGMSCHSARFATPSANSLSEIYVLNSLGAAAYWGSTGFGYITQDFFLLDGLFSSVMKDTVRSLGAATTLAKIKLWQTLGDQSRSRFVIDQYALIGDPALSLRLPTKPELHARAEEITFNPALLLTTDSTAQISAKIHNYGLFPRDSVEVGFAAIDPENNVSALGLIKTSPLALLDSTALSWNLPDRAGEYRIQVHIDPENRIEEEDEANNLAERTVVLYTSDLSIVKPIEFGMVQTATPELVTNNSKIFSRDLIYYFETDTSNQFNSPLLQQSPAISQGVLVTKWQPQLSQPGVYFWRVRTFDGELFGPWATASFTYQPGSEHQWQQSQSQQFSQNQLLNTMVASDQVTLRLNRYAIRVESAGFSDGNFTFFEINEVGFSRNFRGHNLVVMDERNGQVLLAQTYDTYADPAAAEAMAHEINNLPAGRIVLAAICDDGSSSMTENAYLALEGVGSGLTRSVGFRDSWAIIGVKGSAMGSVVEAMKKSGEGPVVIADTLARFATLGQTVSPEIGPARSWKSLTLSFNDMPPQTRIEFAVLGKNLTGQFDSLRTAIAGVSLFDLSPLDASAYPVIKLAATLTSADGRSTPQLNSWAVDFSPPADLIVAPSGIALSADTVLAGENLEVKITTANFGLGPADSFSISVFHQVAGGKKELARIQTRGLEVDASNEYSTVLSAPESTGKMAITVEVDPEKRIIELDETNNQFSLTIWVVKDTLAPRIRVTFDGREVGVGDFVSANPEIVAEIRDAANVAFTDTSQVVLFLDGKKVVYGSAPGQAQFVPTSNPQDKELKALAIFQPTLSTGEHQLKVQADDPSANRQILNLEFTVSSDFLLSNVMNYPNPFEDHTDFTYVLTQDADEVRLKIFTVAGRLIYDLDFLPNRVGFNQFRWDGRDRAGDVLANGVYLYKLIARKGDQQMEVVEKLVVMR